MTWDMWTVTGAAGAVVLAAWLLWVWRGERQLTAQVREEEWARTLAVAAECGWPPYTPSGLSGRAELAWRDAWLRTAPHCRPVKRRDGTTEWLYVQPGEGDSDE